MRRPYTIGLSIILLLFISLFFILSFNMRLASDDYFFIWDVKTHGIMESVYLQYIQWCGRYFAVFLYDVFYWLFETKQIYYSILSIAFFILIIIGIFRLLSVTAKQFNFQLTRPNLFLASLSFTSLLFFLSFDIGETWFWYCSMSSYLWSIISFVWGISFLISNKNNVFTYIGIILSFIYCGGSSEVYSVIYGLLLCVLFVLQWKRNKGVVNFVKLSFNKKLIVSMLSLSFSFFVVLIAKGNYSRATQFPDPTILTTLLLTGRMILKLFGWFLPQKLLFIFVFFIPFLLLGKSFNKGEKISFIIFLKSIKNSVILLLISMVLVFAMIAIIMSQSGEYRVWFIISFLVCSFMVYVSFLAGLKGLMNDKVIYFLSRISILIGVILMTFTIYNQIGISGKYASGYDERTNHLIQLNNTINKDSMVVLAPLPPPGMLYSSEITNDTFSFSNRELRLGLELKYHIIVENKP